MARLVLKNLDAETAEKLELRAKRLGTTPEEEAAKLLRERLRGEPQHEPVPTGTAAAITPALVTMASEIDPQTAADLAALEASSVEQQEQAKKKTSDAEDIQHLDADRDSRFVRKHGFLVFVGAVKAEEIPDHRVLRDERLDALLEGIHEGRV